MLPPPRRRNPPPTDSALITGGERMTGDAQTIQVTLNEVSAGTSPSSDAQPTPSPEDPDKQPDHETTAPPSHARTSTLFQFKDSAKAPLLLTSADLRRLDIDPEDVDEFDYWITDGHLVIAPTE